MEGAVSKKNAGIKELLLCRDYMKILIANGISRFGDSIDSVAYGWMVYTLTGSKLLMGTLFAVNAIPNIIFSPFAGTFVDRLPKKKVVAAGNIGRGIVVSLTATLLLLKLLRPWHLFVFTFLNTTFETFMSPAASAIVPMVLPRELYLGGNSVSSSVNSFAELIGLAAAGAIIALTGISGAIFIDGLTFFAACIIILFVNIKDEVLKKTQLTVKVYFTEFKEGFSFVIKNTLIFTTILLGVIVNFCFTPINVLQFAFVKDVLKAGPEVLSTLGIGLFAGMIIGGLLVGQFGSRFKNSTLIISGLMLCGISYSLLCLPGNSHIGYYADIVLAAVMFFILGFSSIILNSTLRTYIMMNTPKEILGRVVSVLGMMSMCAIPLGSAITGAVSQYVSMSLIFLVMGAVIVLVTMPLLFYKKFRNI